MKLADLVEGVLEGVSVAIILGLFGLWMRRYRRWLDGVRSEFRDYKRWSRSHPGATLTAYRDETRLE